MYEPSKKFLGVLVTKPVRNNPKLVLVDGKWQMTKGTEVFIEGLVSIDVGKAEWVSGTANVRLGDIYIGWTNDNGTITDEDIVAKYKVLPLEEVLALYPKEA